MTPLSDKLKIKAGFQLLVRNEPDNFLEMLQPLPAGVKLIKKTAKPDQVHWFVTDRSQLEKELDDVMSNMTGDITCWVYYPKGNSKIQTDLTRDKGWDALLKHEEVKWISLISFDETWSAFGFHQKSAADIRKAEKPKEREIFQYINAATKEIRLPEDLQKAFNKNKKAGAYFESLAFSHKKEYVESIVISKKEETRERRISATIEKLEKGMKNPAQK